VAGIVAGSPTAAERTGEFNHKPIDTAVTGKTALKRN
jgi:hypothetical protein